jgi:hypothetical protein
MEGFPIQLSTNGFYNRGGKCLQRGTAWSFNPLTPELNPSAQRCLPRFFTGILIFKGLTARRLYKSFGIKWLNKEDYVSSSNGWY